MAARTNPRNAGARVPTLSEANRQRTARAADRDVAIATVLLLTHPGDTLYRARFDHPFWSWSQLAGHLGTTKDAAVSRFRRDAQRAGLRDDYR